MFPARLRVLQVEDNPEDAKLILRALTTGGFEPVARRVLTAEELSAALREGAWDVILCDYSLPRFSGEHALKLVREMGCDAPVIFVSGTIGEETAVNAMRMGAQDYVMKDKLARLAPAVRRELQETQVRRQARQADRHLRESEHKYRHLFESLNDAAFLLSEAADRVADTNAAAERLLQTPRAQILGIRLADRFSPKLSLQETTQSEYETALLRPDGTRVPVRVSLSRITLNDRYFILALVHDLTEHEKTEAARLESESRFQQVTDNIREVFWLRDLAAGRLIYVSPAYQTVWGRSCESLYENPDSWLDAIHPDDRSHVRSALPELREGAYDLEYRIVRADGSTRWIHDRASAIKTPTGEVSRVAGIAEDVTQRRQLEQQFRQAQKMEAVGQLAGGIAHDFNNILTIVAMQCSLLTTQYRDPAIEAGLQQVLDAVSRGVALTRQLLTFSRRDVSEEMRPIDLAAHLGPMIKLLKRILGEQIEVVPQLPSGLPMVLADGGKMEQILMNLVINARDAMPTGGTLGIRLDPVEVDEKHVARHATARPGRYIQLKVTDTGSGIAPDVIPRIFEPFFTTKDIGKGTGLGLATVLSITQQHKGWIEVESVIGRGTEFRVFLPAMKEAAPSKITTVAPAQPIGGTGTILIVEDESVVRSLVVETLTRLGYRVLDASTAAEALKEWQAANGAVDLLLTDVVIPGGKSGQELAAELQALRPELKVVYSTGYSGELVSRLPVRAGWDYLAKPYSIQDLTAVIQRRLAKPAASSE